MDTGALNKKMELIQWISTLENESIINQLLKLRNQENKDWWAATSTKERESIEKGLSDADEGKLTSHAEVKKGYGKWL